MFATSVLWIDPAGTPPELPGIAVSRVAGLDEALGRLAAAPYETVVAHVPLPGVENEDLLEALLRASPGARVLFRGDFGSPAEAISLARQGLAQWLPTGAEARLLEEIGAGPETVESGNEPWRKFLAGDSPAIERLGEAIERLAPRRCTVLITGETGTGKELAARALHACGSRARKPFVAVNCSALPAPLLEAELFGHVRGAFTGAIQDRAGRFEQAHQGTLFLDEIGDLPMELQSKLLRVLQEREFERVGSNRSVQVDVRVVAATHRDLQEMVRQGQFREDLYFRLHVATLHTPALREHPGDVAALARRFVRRACEDEGLDVKTLTPETQRRLEGYAWPGNVRQLENAIEAAVAMSGDREWLYPADFSLPEPARESARTLTLAPSVPESGLDFEAAVARMERALLEEALRRSQGNKKRAADLLRLKRTTLAAKLRSLDLKVA